MCKLDLSGCLLINGLHVSIQIGKVSLQKEKKGPFLRF